MFKKEYGVLFEVKDRLNEIEKGVMEVPKDRFEEVFSEIVKNAEKVYKVTNKFGATVGRLSQYHKALKWFGNYDLFCCIYTVKSLVQATENYLAEQILLAELKRQAKEFEAKLVKDELKEVKYYEKKVSYEDYAAMAVAI